MKLYCAALLATFFTISIATADEINTSQPTTEEPKSLFLTPSQAEIQKKEAPKSQKDKGFILTIH